MKSIWPTTLGSLHINIGIPLGQGIELLKTLNKEIHEEHEENEHSFRVYNSNYQIAIYEENNIVKSVWYNDPSGRLLGFGKKQKINLYLKRYCLNGKWEKRMENDWMKYYFNDIDNIQMVYGKHMDVIRFNDFSEN